MMTAQPFGAKSGKTYIKIEILELGFWQVGMRIGG